MNMFVYLAGFHQLMSFLGSIECLMEGSGPLWRQFMHHYLLGMCFQEKRTLMLFEDIYYLQQLCSHYYLRTKKLIQWFENKKEHLVSISHTSQLWLNYIIYDEMLQLYFQAERAHDWSSHLSLTQQMLNIFAVTGHNKYVKTSHLCVQSAMGLERDFSHIYQQIIDRNYTV